jgi:hypothetical protein
VIGLVIYNLDVYFGCLIFILYILYYIIIFINFLFRVYLSFHVIHVGIFSNVHKILLYSHMIIIFTYDYYIILKYGIGICVQSRKQDQILRLDLNLY